VWNGNCNLKTPVTVHDVAEIEGESMGRKYIKRVNNLIQRKLTELLLRESKDPRLAEITITDVSVNRDTSRAEVYYSLIGDEEDIKEVQAALEGASGWIRHELAPVLRLRNVPEFVFIYDPSLAHGAKIEALLAELREERASDDEEIEESTDEDSVKTSSGAITAE
jgi:ribosome-binding factor A